MTCASKTELNSVTATLQERIAMTASAIATCPGVKPLEKTAPALAASASPIASAVALTTA